MDPAQNEALQQRSAGGHRSTLISQGLRVLCKAIGLLALARLVTPQEHGLYAMAATVTLFIWMFRDLGLGTAAIQSPTLSRGVWRRLGWIHVLLGAAAMSLTVAASSPAAALYGEPALAPLLNGMGVSFVFIGIGGMPRSRLARDLQFGILNRIDSIAAVVGTAAMIGSAVAGAGAWSFAIFLLVSEFLSAVLAWPYCPREAKGPSPAPPSLGPLFRTGWQVIQFQVLNYLSLQVEIVAVGRAAGAYSLGLYNRAGQLLNLTQQHVAEPLAQVSLPALSRFHESPSEFRRQAFASTNVVGHLTLPLAALAVAAPEALIRVVLGPQWPEAAPLLRWLAVSAALVQSTVVANSIAIAAGQSRRLVALAMLSLPLTISAVALGAWSGGAEGVAMAAALLNTILVLPRLAWRLRGSTVSTASYLSALAGPIISASILAAGAAGSAALAAAQSPEIRTGATFAGAAGSLVLAGVISARLRAEWSQAWKYISGR